MCRRITSIRVFSFLQVVCGYSHGLFNRGGDCVLSLLELLNELLKQCKMPPRPSRRRWRARYMCFLLRHCTEAFFFPSLKRQCRPTARVETSGTRGFWSTSTWDIIVSQLEVLTSPRALKGPRFLKLSFLIRRLTWKSKGHQPPLHSVRQQLCLSLFIQFEPPVFETKVPAC